jgi:predicted nucleic acid-binding protein
MSSVGLAFEPVDAAGLFVDTNLLVLFTIGSVNRDRIEQFKRTRKYTKTDYDLLLRVLGKFKTLYTVAHVMAEVSNLTDLSGSERQQALYVLREALSVLNEAEMPSTRAADDLLYEGHGLVDAAIAAVARDYHCAVLTDDLDLYLSLSRDKVKVLNFTHLRAAEWGI